MRSKVLSAVAAAAVMSLALAGCGPSKPVTISPKASYTSVQMSKKCDELFGSPTQVGKRFHMTAPIASVSTPAVRRGVIACAYEAGTSKFSSNVTAVLALAAGVKSAPHSLSGPTYETATSGKAWARASETGNAAPVSSKDRSWLESVAKRVKP